MTDRWREVDEREYPRLLRALLARGATPRRRRTRREGPREAYTTGLDNIEELPAWLLVVGMREVFRKAKRPTARRPVGVVTGS